MLLKSPHHNKLHPMPDTFLYWHWFATNTIKQPVLRYSVDLQIEYKKKEGIKK